MAGRSATAQGRPDPVRLRPAADNGTRTADAHVRVSIQRLSARKDRAAGRRRLDRGRASHVVQPTGEDRSRRREPLFGGRGERMFLPGGRMFR